MQKGSAKGISAAVTTLIFLVMLIVGIYIWSSFARGGLGQISPLFQQAEKATGEIPCTKAPTIEIDPVINITPTQREILQLMTFPPSGTIIHKVITFRPSISSSCFENLTITWIFNETDDSQATIETECAAPYTAENCSVINNTYDISGTYNLWRTLPVKVSAFGTRSGFFTQSEAAAFVNDPFFSISAPDVDDSDFSCVKLTTVLQYAATNPNPTFNIIDDGRTKGVESLSQPTLNFEKGGLEYSMMYRASKVIGKEHTVQLSATQGYQTTLPVEQTYKPESLVPKPEIAVSGIPSILNIYKSNNELLDSGLIPSTDYNSVSDMAAGDLDNDGASEFVFFMSDAPANYEGGDIYVQTYYGMKETKTENKLTKDQLRSRWTANAPLRSADGLQWISLAAGKKITTSDGQTGNIVVIGDPGDLALYNYVLGQLTSIDDGDDFTNLDWWRNVKAYDVDGDGEDEIIALRGVKDYNGEHAGDILIFKYADIARADNKAEFDAYPEEGKSHKSSDPYWIDLYDKDWIAVAAGNLIADKTKTIIVNLGPDELDAWWFNKNTKNFGEHHYYTSWPSAGLTWQDMVAVDFNSDEVDELAFLYKKDGKYYVSVLPFSAVGSIDSYDKFQKAALMTMELPSEGVDAYYSLVASDLGCFL